MIHVPMSIVLGLLLLASALISASEAAMLSINKVRLRHLVEQGNRSAQITFDLLKQLDHLVSTLLVANTTVNVVFTAIGSWWIVSIFGSDPGLAIATIVLAALLLLIGEITPKLFAVTHPETVALIMARPLRLLTAVLYPLSTFWTWLGRGLLHLLRVPVKRRAPLVTEEEIKVMIQMGREAGVLAEQELRLLHRIFEFSDSIVRDAMVPRAQIAGVDLRAKPEAVLDVLIEQGHARIPVYQGSLDHVVGVIYARDLLTMVRHGGLFVLADLIRPVAFVPETKRIAELLSEFQQQKAQIAIVQNASKATVGLVTIEDLLEEIVGEIHEERPPTRRA
ncbi:MAG: HlyC/CorC family transporter [Candidatus Omnitrophica bacterium]|nr:HlyC/CorC family transporter [Candidatus Omnitrophota bacterium]